jgi:hypothetical protein
MRQGLIERIRLAKPAPGLPFDNGIFELSIEDRKGNVVSICKPSEGDFSCEGSTSKPVHDKHELLLCANCDQFVLPHEITCPHCSGKTLETLTTCEVCKGPLDVSCASNLLDVEW